MRRIWDISQVLRPALPVWPGDTEFGFERSWRMDQGSPVNVGRMEMSTHSGTHADAPLHYAEDGMDAASMALDPFIGHCLVVDVRGGQGPIGPGELPDPQGTERVLLRQWDDFPYDEWRSDWRPVSPAAIGWLSGQGVTLIGTDAPSVDSQDSKTMDAHHAVLKNDMRILEGLVLDSIAPGRYELIALPLKVGGGDAGLCRAILREWPDA